MRSALDDEYPEQPTLEALAAQAYRNRLPPERYVPTEQPVAPMEPVAPVPQDYPRPPSLTPQHTRDAPPTPGTMEVLQDRPTELPEELRRHFARARRSPSSPTTIEPSDTPTSALGTTNPLPPAVGPAVAEAVVPAEGLVVPETKIPPPPAAPSALTPGRAVSSSTAAATTSTEEPVKVKGARPRQAAVAEREEFPDAVPKAVIDPQYLVRLQESNPALHDAIVSAAAKAGVGSWDYANLIYATSKGDPNYRDKDGRTGIAGLKPEDVAKYQRAYPELFKDEQGNPVDPRDPATNLLLGAQKFRELRDRYGANTANSIAAYYHDPDKIDHAATLTPAEQRQAIGEDGYRMVRQAIGGPDAEKGEAKALQLNPAGTLTAPRVIEAAVQSARNGDPRGFFSVMADGLPRGMSSTDGWKHTEALGVSAMLMRGNVEGAQKVRDLMFQMSHVGANQALMRARQAMEMGDNAGAAQQLALFYWATPDGGMARIHVTPQGLTGQRYNEATGTRVGAPFQITKQGVEALLNQTRDPQTFLKQMQTSQKHNADIEKTHAETAHKKAETTEVPSKIALREAQAEELKERPDLRQMESENTLTGRILAEQARLARAGGAGDARAEAALRTQIAALSRHAYPLVNELDKTPIEYTEDQLKEQTTFGDIIFHNPHMVSAPLSTTKKIAAGITNGTYAARPILEGDQKGYGLLHDKNGKSIGVVLSPAHMRLLGKASPASSGAGQTAR